ncbi:MAG: polyphosphate kinase 1 [Myxococcales bacterium]|nr:polyphosphate kinase 1 [Myxococcales bacterium]
MTDTTTKPTPELDLSDPGLYINRELSLLEFQRRVLEEAEDPNSPLLERVKFISILNSNLDEFFMVRVAGLKQQIQAGVGDRSPDGRTPAEQLNAVRQLSMELLEAGQRCFQSLLPELDAAGVRIMDYSQLNAAERSQLTATFLEMVFPVLTPLAMRDPGHPFPHISNLSLNLAILLEDDFGNQRYARIKVPRALPRLVPVAGEEQQGDRFVWIEQLITNNLDSLFPGMTVIEAHPFHVTRDADMEIQVLEASDLLKSIEKGLHERQFNSPVRLMINPDMSSHLLDIFVEEMELDTSDVYALEGPLGLSSIMQLYGLERWELKSTPFKPVLPEGLEDEPQKQSMFDVIRERDLLIFRPYDSFIPFIDLLEEAAQDPNVLAIKQTLYRVGRNSPVVQALLQARRKGKQVTVLVELKARFDEESNIEWAKALENEGVHVVYGLHNLKTHCKIALVVRKEGDHIQRYVHMATGNYNAVTARLYTDIGLFTSDKAIVEDSSHLFNYLTGYSAKRDYNKLLVAPVTLREQMLGLIQREAEHQQSGRRGHVIFQMNSLVDSPMIQALYEASRAGVQIDLIVRGICCLRPGVPGVSDNIRVISVVGRYLEHSRIYYFRNGGDEEIYVGSADMMPRNLDRRVELLFPIKKDDLIRRVRDGILDIYLADNVTAREMQTDGSYVRLTPDGDEPVSCQEWFMQQRQATSPQVTDHARISYAFLPALTDLEDLDDD